MKPISKMDWDIIDARVTKACDRHKFQKRTVGFLAIVIDQIFPGHEDQLQEIITDGPDDKGVDAIHVVEGESSAEVFLFQSKYRESHGTCHKTINSAFPALVRLVGKQSNGLSSFLSAAPPAGSILP